MRSQFFEPEVNPPALKMYRRGGGYPLYMGGFCTFSGIPKNRKIALFGVRIHPFWPKIRPGQAHDLPNLNFMLPGQKKPKNEEKQAKEKSRKN